LLLINKPRGMTSFAVVSCLRKMTGIRKIGHAGTLDPFAEGLLPIVIGRATAAVQFMASYSKVYELEMEFGWTTDTYDLTGKTMSVCPLDDAVREQLRASGFASLYAAVDGLAGEHLQVPPMYSAVKIGGTPLYVYARRGEEIERPGRPIQITRASVISVSLDQTLQAKLLIHCSKGTYIRNLADDIGRQLGFGAVATRLIRLESGPFKLDEAWDLVHLQAISQTCACQSDFLRILVDEKMLLPVSRAFCQFPELDLPPGLAERLINGQSVILTADFLSSAGRVDCADAAWKDTGRLVVNSKNRLIAVACLKNDEPGKFQLRTERVLIDLADFRQA
jgi:tRNA pseudouridine55 synthase